jgi:hypothetical protein
LDVVPYLIFLVGLWNVLKNDFREVDEWCFMVAKGHANSFSESWVSTKATWKSCLSDVFSRRKALGIYNVPS